MNRQNTEFSKTAKRKCRCEFICLNTLLLAMTLSTPIAFAQIDSIKIDSTPAKKIKSTHSENVVPKDHITSYDTLPSLSAVIRRYSINSPDVFSDSWVTIAPYGMRVTDLATRSEVLKNFVNMKVWMINRKHKIQHEVNVEEFATRYPELAHILVGPDTNSNILGREPCADWNGVFNGERVWRGSVVQDWDCTDDLDFTISQQIYSSQHGVVVKVRHANGLVEELRDVTENDKDESYFYAEQGFNTVSFSEFMTGKAQLERYGN